MIWAIGFLAVVVVALGVLIATGRLGGMAAEPIRDVYRPVLPEGRLLSADLKRLKLGVSVQGYSMSQVDDLLDRLAGEIAERDHLIEELRIEEMPHREFREEPHPATNSPLGNSREAVAPPRREPIGNNEDDR